MQSVTKYRFRRWWRRFKYKLKYRLSMLAVFIVVALVFVAAFFMVHGHSLNIGGGLFGGLSKPDNYGSTVSGTMEVHYIDVGQGDATLIRCGEHAMLIDGGNDSSGTKLLNYLKSLGIKKLDYVIATHPESDHIGGLDVVLYRLQCDTILMADRTADNKAYEHIISAMKSKNYKSTEPQVGARYYMGEAVFDIIAPVKKYEDANDSSIGIILRYGDSRFLFTGDAESQGEKDIVTGTIDIGCDVYKVGHHGSSSSSTVELLNRSDPTWAVISCGKDNDYGHPHGSVLRRLKNKEIKIFRTDKQGTIIATTDGKNITWNSAEWVE